LSIHDGREGRRLGRPEAADVRADAWVLDKFAYAEGVIDITTRQARCLRETEGRQVMLGGVWAGWNKRRRN
jgi:hypothetical protein